MIQTTPVGFAEVGATGWNDFGDLRTPAKPPLKPALYDAPEDLYFELDDERLVNLAGFSPGKARQLKWAASNAVSTLTGGVAPVTAKPLSEPEARDAQQYDATVAAAAVAAAAAASSAGSGSAPPAA